MGDNFRIHNGKPGIIESFSFDIQKNIMKLDQGVKSWRISESAWKNW